MAIACTVLGTGYWGKNILRNLNALGALAGFFDSDPDAQVKFAAEYPNATAHADISEALSDDAVPAVAIATPAETHGALVRQALNAGKHVFVEKPLCLEVEDARNLQALAAEQGRILMVGHLLLYHPAFLALQQSVANGDIGRLRYVYSTRASLGKIRRNENALWSFAPHDISMMLALTGRMPDRIVCNGEAWLSPSVADMTLSHFDFGDQLQGHIFVSWMHPFKDHRLVVVGESGMLVFNDTLPGKEKLQRYPHAIGWKDQLPVMDKADAVPVPYGDAEPLRSEMEHFLDCCATGVTPRSDGEEGVRVLTVLDMCQRSLDSKEPVTLEQA